MNLETTTTKIDTLNPHHRNPRRGNIGAIAQSLERLGQYRPIVINTGTHTGRPNEILAGNHTWEAARKLGWETIQTVTIDVDEDTATRILIVDNRSSDIGEYDNSDLLAVLSELPDLDATGYNNDDLDALQQAFVEPGNDDWSMAFDSVPDGDSSRGITRTFNLTVEQGEIVDRAIADASRRNPVENQQNAHSLVYICERYNRETI